MSQPASENPTSKSEEAAAIEQRATWQRKFAVENFNFVWTLLDKPVRTIEEELNMIHAAHASRWHWQAAGSPRNWAIGEWQVSRVYAVLGRPEPAVYHARASLALCLCNDLDAFITAYAYEAIARAAALTRQTAELSECVAHARRLAESIADDDDRQLLLADLATITLSE